MLRGIVSYSIWEEKTTTRHSVRLSKNVSLLTFSRKVRLKVAMCIFSYSCSTEDREIALKP